MIFEFKLPKLNPFMTTARLERLHAAVGATLKPGDKFIDLGVDLSSAFSQDCPPITFYRVVIREHAILRGLDYAAGDSLQVCQLVALFSSQSDESMSEPAARAIRFATAGIVRHPDMWSGGVL